MKVQLLEEYFPLPIIQNALYRLTPVVAAEIEPAAEGSVTVQLSSLTPSHDDKALAALFNQTLVAVAIADRAWQDYQYIRELHARAALSPVEAEEVIIEELARTIHGEDHALTCWGRERGTDTDRQRLALMRQSIPLQIDMQPEMITVVINTAAYPWPMVLRAVSRVQFSADVMIETSPSDTVTVRLQPHMDAVRLAEWFRQELEQLEAIQPALYPPMFSLAETFVTASREA